MVPFGENLEMERNQKMWQKLSILVAMFNVITGLSTQIVRNKSANLGSQWRLMTVTEEDIIDDGSHINSHVILKKHDY